MKKKILIVLLILLLIGLIIGGMYLIDRIRMKNNQPVKFSTWGYSYAPPLKVKEDKKEDENNQSKVTISNNNIKNVERIDNFIINSQNKETSSVAISTYTIEGDEIITTLKYIQELEQFFLAVDNTRDRYSAEYDRKVEITTYTDFEYDVVKRTDGEYIQLVLEVDKEQEINTEKQLEDVIICTYKE